MLEDQGLPYSRESGAPSCDSHTVIFCHFPFRALLLSLLHRSVPVLRRLLWRFVHSMCGVGVAEMTNIPLTIFDGLKFLQLKDKMPKLYTGSSMFSHILQQPAEAAQIYTHSQESSLLCHFCAFAVYGGPSSPSTFGTRSDARARAARKARLTYFSSDHSAQLTFGLCRCSALEFFKCTALSSEYSSLSATYFSLDCSFSGVAKS